MSDNFTADLAIGEILDYEIDYEDAMALSDPDDTIVDSTWSTAICGTGTDLTFTNDIFDATKVWITLSGAALQNRIHKVKNTMTTIGGRVYVRTITVTIVPK